VTKALEEASAAGEDGEDAATAGDDNSSSVGDPRGPPSPEDRGEESFENDILVYDEVISDVAKGNGIVINPSLPSSHEVISMERNFEHKNSPVN